MRHGTRPGHIISIHALRKESDRLFRNHVGEELPISIHALRKESDAVQVTFSKVYPISIHALRKESDPTTGEQYPPLAYFNPRSP